MVTAQEVRDFLSKISTQRIHDDTINLQIEVANTLVESEKSAKATADQIKDAKLVRAAYLSLLAYATEMERSAGKVPAPVLTHISVLEQLAEQLLKIVKRGAPAYKPGMDQPATLLEQYLEGELQEASDYY